MASLCDWQNDGQLNAKHAVPSSLESLLQTLGNAVTDSAAQDLLKTTAANYAKWWTDYFSIQHDPSDLHGETNHFRYRTRDWHLVRIEDADVDLFELAKIVVATQLLSVDLMVSLPNNAAWSSKLPGDVKVTIESQQDLAKRLAKMSNGSIRFIGDYDVQTMAPSEIGNTPIVRSQVLNNGRLELLNYLREQSMTEIVHRYGNIV